MYHVEISNSNDTIFKAKSKDSEFIIDTKGKGITPPDALLASLGSCIGVYIRKYAEGARLELGEFTITVDAEFSEDKPMRFKDINVSIGLKGLKLEEQRKKAAIEFIKNCPVHNTIKNNPSVNVRII